MFIEYFPYKFIKIYKIKNYQSKSKPSSRRFRSYYLSLILLMAALNVISKLTCTYITNKFILKAFSLGSQLIAHTINLVQLVIGSYWNFLSKAPVIINIFEGDAPTTI